MIVANNFTKRLTLLFYKDSTHDYDDLIEKQFGCVLYSFNVKNTLAKFDSHYIDMILIELEKDNEDKLKFIESLKIKYPFLIILVLSKVENISLLQNILDVGVDAFFKNPLDIEEFKLKVQKLEFKYEVGEEFKNNKENLNLLKQYQDIADKSSIISKTDLNGKITYANDNFCKISGYTKDELIGKSHNMIRHPDTKKEIFAEMWHTIKDQKKQWNGIIRNISKSGESYYVNSTITPILDKNGSIIEYIALRQNISSILSDKKHFLDKIDSNVLSLLILIQIEDFDMLEKFYNLTTIDKIEKMFGFKLLSYLPKTYKFDNVYNLDNGRYALVTDFYSFEDMKISIKDYLDEFVNNVKRSTLEINSIEYDINIALSYAMGKHMLYEDAKAGLEEAIEKDIIVCHSNDFSIKHQKEAKKNLDVIKMVKIALENYKIVSYFQPIINNKTKQIDKYESLVRLIDEDGNVIAPYKFLAISKKGTYYNKITQRVLENSFRMLKSVTTELSINLSTLDIEKEETRDKIYELLEEYKFDRNRLVFELLEDENAKDFQSIKNFIKKVKSLGVSIAIDDFGAGYSNFERLLEFEPDILKIDGSLIQNIINDKYSRNIVETIVTFAKKQDIMVVAEFVENEEIFNYLNEIGVDYSQGYYFGKPEEFCLE